MSNLQASVQDGELLAGFTDDSVDAVTCTWGLESMDPALAIQVRFARESPIIYYKN